MTAPDIFLSYNREDSDRAKQFAQGFENEGFKVWWDVALRSGEAYDKVTEDALRGAKAVVVLWSPRSVESRWVRAEATLADRNKVLVPAMIEPCDRPIMFELTQTAELCHWDGDPFDGSWQAFLKDVRGFVERARAKEGPTPAAAPGLPQRVSRGRPTIAIMPFANRSGVADDEVFARGMVEDLIDAISTSEELRVIASSATRSYADTAYDAREVGEELDARYLLEGNIRRSGDQLRVTAQLIDVADGAVLWSQRFECPLANLASLQEDLVTEVAANMGVQLTRIEVEKALKKPGDLTAWEGIMRAEALTLTQTQENLLKGLEEARRAAQIAPDYGLAHAVHARTAGVNYWQSQSGRTEEMRREIQEAANKALEIERDNPAILARVAEALCVIGMWRKGLRCAEQAFKIAPDRASSHEAMIMVCQYYKRADEALVHLDAYEKLAPRGRTVIIRLTQRSGAYYLKGDYQRSLDITDEMLMLNPNFMFALKDVVILLEKLGRREEALDALAEFKEAMPHATLEFMERVHSGSVLAPDIAQDMYEAFATVWLAAEEAGGKE